ncbi:MAG: T9SS type A sorting domain-containing protein [Paludibacter sp.]|nr:T9SS type A sorting domain-containing protein [Paludibacter sp.]
MRKFTLVILSFLVSWVVASAAVAFPVDYSSFFTSSAMNSNGTSVETGNAAAVGTWAMGNAGTNAVSPTIADNNLSYPGYIDNNAGKKISLASLVSGSTARTSAFYITSAVTDLTSGPYYLSFLLNVSSVTGSALNLISFGNASVGGSLRGRLYIKAVTGGYILGATIDGSPLNYYTADTLKLGVTKLIVLKHKIDLASATVGSGTTSIFVNPPLGAAEPATANATATETAAVTGLDCIKSMVVSQNVGVAAEIAGLRMSNAWEDVVKLVGGPKLTTPTVSSATMVNSTGFTVNWTPVQNALSYDIKVYQNGSMVKTLNVSGQSSSTGIVTSLQNILAYTYTVTAVGNVTNFSNSDASLLQTVILPLNYTTFFAPSAVGSGETALETGNTSVANTWTLAGTANGTNPAISSSDLSYSNYIDNNIGKKIVLSDITAQRTSLFYLTSSSSDLTVGTYYLSFLLKIITPPTASGVTLISFANSNTGGQRGRLNIMPIGAGYQLAASLTGSSTYYPSTLAFGTTYLVVVKHEITVASATAGEATTSLFVNPIIGNSEPDASATKTESGITSLDCIKGIAINQQSGLNAEIAGLRIGSNWDNVVTLAGANALSTPEMKKLTVAVVSANEWRVNLNAISGQCLLSVYNPQGQVLLQKNLESEKTNSLNVSLPKGLYIVLLQSEKDKYTTKVISK